MWRLDRLETEDSLLDEDDEWLDDAMPSSDFSLRSVNIVLAFFFSQNLFPSLFQLVTFDLWSHFSLTLEMNCEKNWEWEKWKLLET